MADVERRAANWLRVASVVLMAAMITVAGFTFYHSIEHPEVDWRLFSFRLATSIILLIPAVYLAQESAKHRDREKKNRKLHLELAAIDAYLALQPEDKRNAIKAELTGKFFGQPEVESKDEEVSKHALFQLVSDIVKNLTKAK